jgi:hypothetical protein
MAALLMAMVACGRAARDAAEPTVKGQKANTMPLVEFPEDSATHCTIISLL